MLVFLNVVIVIAAIYCAFKALWCDFLPGCSMWQRRVAVFLPFVFWCLLTWLSNGSKSDDVWSIFALFASGGLIGLCFFCGFDLRTQKELNQDFERMSPQDKAIYRAAASDVIDRMERDRELEEVLDVIDRHYKRKSGGWF